MSLSPAVPSIETIIGIESLDEFNALALQIFQYQRNANPVYHGFLDSLDADEPQHWTEIPHLPISAFKRHRVLCETMEAEQVFTSSGTTGDPTSSHHVPRLSDYESSFMAGFSRIYGPAEGYCILGLLPAYMERKGSSLVYMVKQLIQASDHALSGTYLYDYERLAEVLERLRKQGQATILFGVTFALLDMMPHLHAAFPALKVIETGGMKGRKREMIREELHAVLKEGFGCNEIHSEYGMTELLSQAYSRAEGRYQSPPWMQVQVRDVHDPLRHLGPGRTGGMDIMDLANVHSCAFIATEDLGRLHSDGQFEVLGRFDASDVRGCSLLI